MGAVFGWIAIILGGFSLFTVITAPLEMFKTYRAQGWEQIVVEMVTNDQVAEVASGEPALSIKDTQTQTITDQVQFRYGDLPSSLTFFGMFDVNRVFPRAHEYKPGDIVYAYRSGKTYVIEQNTIWQSLIIWLLSFILPILIAMKLLKKKK
ncbi:MAG: hypothetical protein MRY32_09925 [Rickettsiales bacterium]|nr:hypothetical protein [Rickettsiales bacterium]